MILGSETGFAFNLRHSNRSSFFPMSKSLLITDNSELTFSFDFRRLSDSLHDNVNTGRDSAVSDRTRHGSTYAVRSFGRVEHDSPLVGRHRHIFMYRYALCCYLLQCYYNLVYILLCKKFSCK